MSYPSQLQNVHYDPVLMTIIEVLRVLRMSPVPSGTNPIPGNQNNLWISATNGHLYKGDFDLETGGGVGDPVYSDVPLLTTAKEVATWVDTTGTLLGKAGVEMTGDFVLQNIYIGTGAGSAMIDGPNGPPAENVCIGCGAGGNPISAGGDDCIDNVFIGHLAGGGMGFTDQVKRCTALGHQAGAQITNNQDCCYLDNLGVPGENNTLRIGEVLRHNRAFLAGTQGVAAPVGLNDIVTINQTTKQLASMAYEEFNFITTFTGYNSADVAVEVQINPISIRVTKVGRLVSITIPSNNVPVIAANITRWDSNSALPARFLPSPTAGLGVARTGDSGSSLNPEMGFLLVETTRLIICRSAYTMDAAFPFTAGVEAWQTCQATYTTA